MKSRPKSGSLGIIDSQTKKKGFFSTLFGSSKRKSVNIAQEETTSKRKSKSSQSDRLSPFQEPTSPNASSLSNSLSSSNNNNLNNNKNSQPKSAFERIKYEHAGMSKSTNSTSQKKVKTEVMRPVKLIQPTKELKMIEEGKQLTKEDLQETYTFYLQSLPENELFDLISHIPMRLTEKERIYLEILECALDVSEYTNNVDVAKTDVMYYSYGYGYSINQGDVGLNRTKKQQIIECEHADLKKIMCGLLISHNFTEGQRIVKSKEKTEEFLQNCFEVGRRYKAANPSMMRETYQKMMHVLQDAMNYNPKFIGKKFEKSREWKPIYTFEMAMKEKGMKLKDLMKAILLVLLVLVIPLGFQTW